MRITELMLKDWVEVFDPEYDEGEGKNSLAQISQLTITDMGIPLVKFDEWADRYDARTWIRGIRLTDDYLALNGFVQDDWSWKLGDLEIFADGTSGYHMNGIRIEFVHQIQNLMRLYGLTTQANGFILEKQKYDEDI